MTAGPTRRPLAAVVAAALVVGLASCGDEAPESTSPTTSLGLTLGGSDIRAEVRAEGNQGIHDGGEVRVEVEAEEGSEVFGFEAFLCAGGATFELDFDVRPTQAGKCVSKPLSAGSDRYQEVRGVPPYRVVETSFRPGVGTDSFQTSEGIPVTITCGPGSPCQLVLKVQYPQGFGFRVLPLEYAS
jgi:hypothetical protein